MTTLSKLMITAMEQEVAVGKLPVKNFMTMPKGSLTATMRGEVTSPPAVAKFYAISGKVAELVFDRYGDTVRAICISANRVQSLNEKNRVYTIHISMTCKVGGGNERTINKTDGKGLFRISKLR